MQGRGIQAEATALPTAQRGVSAPPDSSPSMSPVQSPSPVPYHHGLLASSSDMSSVFPTVVGPMHRTASTSMGPPRLTKRPSKGHHRIRSIHADDTLAEHSDSDEELDEDQSGAFSTEQFRELLANESYVNMERLREAARHGVPQAVRGEVWKVLLGVSKPDKSQELSVSKKLRDEFAHLSDSRVLATVDATMVRYIRAEIRRFAQASVIPFFKRKETRLVLERILRCYLAQHSNAEFHMGLIYILAPFVYCMPEPADVFYGYTTLLDVMEHKLGGGNLVRALSNFLMLFRTFLGDLCAYFEDEELSPSEWAVVWLRQWLSRSLAFKCVLRLWDTYFSSSEGFDLHIYVCLAILMACEEELLEFEYSELKAFLLHLPVMDMDQIIIHAYNLREEVTAMQLF